MTRAMHWAAWAAALLYLAVGLGELAFADGSLVHRVVFAAALGLFAALVVLGVWLIDDRPWGGTAMASVGAILGGFALFWTVAAVVLAIAIVTLSVLTARRAAPHGAQPA